MTTLEERERTRPDRPPGEPAAARPGAPRKTVARQFRPRRWVPASLVALVLAAAGVLAAIEIISRLLDRPAGILPVGRLARWGRETAWDDPLVLALAVVTALLGLGLLWLAVSPGRTGVVALASDRQRVLLAATWSALRRIATRAAESVDGVDRAKVRARRGRVAVRVDTPLREPGDLPDRVHRAVTDRLDRLEPDPRPKVRVTVRRRED